MAANYYLKESTGNDSNDGLTYGTPRQHISAIIAILPPSISETITVHFDGTVASPRHIPRPRARWNFRNLTFTAGGELIFQPYIWNQDNYVHIADPYNASTGAGTFDPKAAKPCVVPPFALSNTKCVRFYGLAFMRSDSVSGVGFETRGYCDFEAHYCSMSDCNLGFTADLYTHMALYNIYAHHNWVGVASAENSIAELIGENYLIDNQRVGAIAGYKSSLIFKAWPANSSKFVTRIETTVPLLKYSAIRALSGSMVDVMDAFFEDDDVSAAHVQILNSTSYRSKQYDGVKLESGAMITGTENISFADPSINDGKDTVQADQQIVGCNMGGTISLP